MPTAALNRLFGQVEGVDLAAELGAANDVYWIASFVKGNEGIQQLVLAAKADRTVANEILGRVVALLETETDTDRAHRYDRALAVYLLVLYASDSLALRKALEEVYARHDRLPNLWWTYRAYNNLITVLSREATQYSEGPWVSPDIPTDVRFSASEVGTVRGDRVTGTTGEITPRRL